MLQIIKRSTLIKAISFGKFADKLGLFPYYSWM